MLKPKQIVPLYNGARAWFVAGTYKGSSLEDGAGNSEASDIEHPRDSNKGFVRRASFNLTKENLSSNFPAKASESSRSAKSHNTKPFKPFCNGNAPLAGDFAHKASAVHDSVVDGLIEGSVPSKLLNKGSAVSGVSSGRQENPTKISSSTTDVKLSTEAGEEVLVQDNNVVFTDHVRKAGFAAAGRISDFQDSFKRGDGTSYMVHRTSRPCIGDVTKQKKKADGPYASVCNSEREASHLGYSHFIGERAGTKSGFSLKNGRNFSTCNESIEAEGQLSNPISLLNESLNRMKLGTQRQPAPTIAQEKKKLSRKDHKVEAPDQSLSMVPYMFESCHGVTGLHDHSGIGDWQAKSECPSTLRSSWRRGETQRGTQDAYHRVNRQGRAGLHVSRNGGREVIEHVCNILGRGSWGIDTEIALSNLDRPLTPYHVNEILKRQQDVGLASEIFYWAKRQEGFKHDVHTFTTMLGILGRARKFDAVASLLEDMVMDGCKPSVVTFNRLIHCYGRAKQMAEALQIFHHMQHVGCLPDKVTYCTLIDLHAKAGFFDVAMDMYKQMQQAGLQPDTFTYSVMINCLGKAGELSAAQKILNEMIGKGCIPNLVTYNILIDLHAKSGKYDMALKLYNDMQETGFRPDQVTYSIVMEVLGHAGHLEGAEHVFAEMQEAGWTPDTTVYGLLVDMWGKAGNLGKACAWYNKMLDSGVTPNVPTCNSLLGAFLRENMYDAGRQVLQDMLNQNLAPSLQTYTLLLSCFTMSESEADGSKLWSIMASLSHPAHIFLCCLPPARFGQVYTWDYTTQFFDSICREDQESKRSFTDATISFLHKFNMKVEAAIVWEVAAEKKIYPKAVTRKAANYWAINLHTMSMGTAIIALSRTLSNLKEGMLATGIVPERIDIITGWGRRSRVTGSSLVKQAVEEILKAVSSPFHLESGNLGCFVGFGQPLADWLHESDMNQLHLI